MNNGLMIREMVAVVERERMVHVARRNRIEEDAQGGRNGGPVERTKMMVGALLQRMGRPLRWGSAPAGEGHDALNDVDLDGVRYSNQSMSSARY